MPRPRKREAELAYPRERNGKDKGVVSDVTKGELLPVTIPHADSDWHPIAKRMYASFRTSGQAHFWQNSDWNFAWHVMDDLSEYKKSGKRSSMMLAEVNRALERLLVTEADRRKARIELMAPEEEETPAAVIAIADYREALGVTG